MAAQGGQQLQGLLPTDLSQFGSLQDALRHAGLIQIDGSPQPHWYALASALGDPNLGFVAGIQGFQLLALLPADWIRATLPSLAVNDGTGNPRGLNAIEWAPLNLVCQIAVAKMGGTYVSLAPQAATAQGQTQNGAAAAATPTRRKIKAAKIIDQGSTEEVEELDPDAITQHRDVLKQVNGGASLAKEDFTDAQITLLHNKVYVLKHAPYTDFGVWVANGLRHERKMNFVAHFQDANGEWKTMEIQGPPDWDIWWSSWRVFRSAALALNIAVPATLGHHAEQLRERVELWEGCWFILVRAEERSRRELWPRIRRQLEDKHKRDPANSDFNPSMPWDLTMRVAASDHDFWEKELTRPGETFLREGPKPSKGRRKWMDGSQQSVGSDGSPRQVQNPPGTGKRQKKKQNLVSAVVAALKESQNGGGYKPTKGQGKGKEGRYNRDAKGNQICYKYARDGACTKDPKKCPERRAHICEYCRGPHTNAECPQSPKDR